MQSKPLFNSILDQTEVSDLFPLFMIKTIVFSRLRLKMLKKYISQELASFMVSHEISKRVNYHKMQLQLQFIQQLQQAA